MVAFWSLADVFRPDRWIEAAKDEAMYKEMAATIDLAFGHGKFQCLGKVIAAMELNKIFVEVGPFDAILSLTCACHCFDSNSLSASQAI